MKDETGALLISFIIIMTLVGILGSSMAFLGQNEIYALKSANSIEQSYYLSESGLRFAMLKRDAMTNEEIKKEYEYEKKIIQMPKKTFSTPELDDVAGFFSLKFNNAERDLMIHSTGQVDTRHFVDARRQTNVKYYSQNNEFPPPEILFDESSFLQTSIYRKWNLDKTFSSDLVSVGGVESLQFKSDEGRNWVLASLYWSKNDLLPDLRIWQDVIKKVLEYDLQIKINFYPKYGQRKNDFMAGLSFRIGVDRKNFYGISFFKSSGRNVKNPACWLISDTQNCDGMLGDSFQFNGEDESCDSNPSKCLETNIPYILFWVKLEKEPFELLAFSDLTKLINRGSVLNDRLSEWEFKPWVTLGLRLEEEESAGQKINDIQIFVQGSNSTSPDSFESKLDWDWNSGSYEKVRFEKVGPTNFKDKTHIRDRTLPSTDLSKPVTGKEIPDEIGFHALYDNRIKETYKYDIYFNDFGVKCPGRYCPTPADQAFVQF
ncbi:MAG: hypothetical protein HQK75_04825 [Candidatus Magnetomorum sp.]|nr:hypothetical protein [Candidatus Magnetomorum sp.]